MLRKIISLILCFSLLLTHAGLAEVGQTLNLANYITQGPKTLSPLGFQPPVLRYFSYDESLDNYQLLLDPQDLKDKLSEDQTKGLAQEQLNYFMVGLSLPNSKFWVNLRPDAPDNIIEPELEQTEVGRIMLESDLQLKKDTALFTSPQTKEGREYWDKLYVRAKELFGSEPANIPTITRPWIVPGEILIREDHGAAYVYKATLKVMLEEDYLKSSQLSAVGYQQYSFQDSRMKELNQYSSQLIRELILPKLTQEVNSGKNYGSLRQVYFSLVLSRWFKARFASQKTENREPRTEQVNLIRLIDTGDLTNLISKTPWSKETYFKEYQRSFKEGEYNLKEQISTPTGQVIRSYVSGGGDLTGTKNPFTVNVFSGPARVADSPIWAKDYVPKILAAILTGILVVGWGYQVYTYKLSDRGRGSIPVVQQEETKNLKLIPKRLLGWGLDYNWAAKVKENMKKDMEIKGLVWQQGEKDTDTIIYYVENPPVQLIVDKDNNYTFAVITYHALSPWPKRIQKVLSYFPDGHIEVLSDGYLALPIGINIFDILMQLGKTLDVEPSPVSSPLTLEQAKVKLGNLIRKYITPNRLLTWIPESSFEAVRSSDFKTIEVNLMGFVNNFDKIFAVLDKASKNLTLEADGGLKRFTFRDLTSFINEIISSIKEPMREIERFYPVEKLNKIEAIGSENEKALKVVRERLRSLYSFQRKLTGLKEEIDTSSQLEEEKIEDAAVEAARGILSMSKLTLEKFSGLNGHRTQVVVDNFVKIYGDSQFLIKHSAKQLAAPVVPLITGKISEEDAINNINKVLLAFMGEDKDTYILYFTSELSRELIARTRKLLNASSALNTQKIIPGEDKFGGIDFTDIEKYLQYDGNFKGLDLSLPLLSKKELESLDLEQEEQTLRNYLATGFNPNGDRLKRLLAGLFQKDQFSSKQLDLLRLSQDLCNFLSARGLETTPDQRAFILIAATGLYSMRQGSLTKYSPN